MAIRYKISVMLLLMALATGAYAKDCYTEHYSVGRQLEKNASYRIKIRSGFVEKVRVQWHDNIGQKHKARGELILDGQSLGTKDISVKGEISRFHARRLSQWGRLSIRMKRDNAWVDWVKVQYCDAPAVPPAYRGPAYGPPTDTHYRVSDCFPKRFMVDQVVSARDHVWLNIPPGYVERLSVRWHDHVGQNHKAVGEVFLDGVSLGTEDIRHTGEASRFGVERFIYGGDVRIRMHRDNAYVKWVEVRYCRSAEAPGATGGRQLKLARRLYFASVSLRQEAQRESRGYAQQAAVEAMLGLEAAADAYYREQREPAWGRGTRRAWRALQHQSGHVAEAMDRARFSRHVEKRWHETSRLLKRLDRQYRH
jgi:hypothetical protein